MREQELQPYDVLQISRDYGETWKDFVTLRHESEFTIARSYVRNPKVWAVQEGADGQGYKFRVWRPCPTNAIVLE